MVLVVAGGGSAERYARWLAVAAGIDWRLLILLQVGVCLAGFAPASVVVVAAGSLYGLWSGLALGSAATLAGSIPPFFAARHLLRRRVTTALGRWLPVERVNAAVRSHGWKIALLLRMSPILPFGAMSYTLGLTDLRWRDYLIGFAGTLPSLFALAYAGAVAGDLAAAVTGEASRSPLQWTLLAAGLIATVTAIRLVVRLARNTLRSSNLDP